MPSREELLESLRTSVGELEAKYRSLGADVLRCECTQSEVPDGGSWTPLDHLAHLTQIEIAFREMCERTLAGDERPIRFEGSSREEILAWVHRWNQKYVESRRSAGLDELLDELRKTREVSVAFVDGLTDEQLAQRVPGAPWGDGTVAGVMQTSATHGVTHLGWVDEGLASIRA